MWIIHQRLKVSSTILWLPYKIQGRGEGGGGGGRGRLCVSKHDSNLNTKVRKRKNLLFCYGKESYSFCSSAIYNFYLTQWFVLTLIGAKKKNQLCRSATRWVTNSDFKLIRTKLVKQNILNTFQLQQQQSPLLDLLAITVWIRNSICFLPNMEN